MCSVWPERISSACGSKCATAFNEAIAPSGRPGRFKMSACAAVPQSARLSGAYGVWFRPADRISSGMPSSNFVQMTRVASGVTSRGPIPVPPVVTTRRNRTAATRSASTRAPASSGHMVELLTLKPSSVRRATTAGPEMSSRAPAKQESLTVMTVAELAAGRAMQRIVAKLDRAHRACPQLEEWIGFSRVFAGEIRLRQGPETSQSERMGESRV